MLSGALVFVDNATYISQIPNPLIHKKHAIIYDIKDKEGMLRDLKYYVAHKDEAKAIARAGYVHVRQYHMAINRADYLLNTVAQTPEYKQMSVNTGT